MSGNPSSTSWSPTIVVPPDNNLASSSTSGPSKKKKQLQGWKHSAAGSLGGMTGAIVTSPFDVVKTRLQSDMFKHHDSLPTKTIRRGGAWHFVDTVYMIRRIAVDEGWRALYKGLGPSLVGIIPARAINFYFYPTSKAYLAERFPNAPTEKEGQTAEDSPLIHLGAAVIAGITTATGTNPIWVVKTRLQLSARKIQPSSSSPILHPSPIPSSSGLPKPIIQSIAALPHLPSSTPSSSITPSRLSALDMTLQIIRQEGFRGLYRGLSASYLGVSEGVIQWVLYERFKRLNSDKPPSSKSQSLAAYITGIVSASGGAKAVASLITYPHEVVRTRLRQPDVGGKKRYTGLIQCLRLVIKEEGVKGLYGGLTAHMFRVVPNAACMFLIYELVAERLGS